MLAGCASNPTSLAPPLVIWLGHFILELHSSTNLLVFTVWSGASLHPENLSGLCSRKPSALLATEMAWWEATGCTSAKSSMSWCKRISHNMGRRLTTRPWYKPQRCSISTQSTMSMWLRNSFHRVCSPTTRQEDIQKSETPRFQNHEIFGALSPSSRLLSGACGWVCLGFLFALCFGLLFSGFQGNFCL